jgi:hypothetical protein
VAGSAEAVSAVVPLAAEYGYFYIPAGNNF